jgi:hypothetical protein
MLQRVDINKSIEWLLAHGSAPVRYLTQRDLLFALQRVTPLVPSSGRISGRPPVSAREPKRFCP